MPTFNVVDVETANADRSSICQIGVIRVLEGNITDKWETLINPETWFDAMNIWVHGINESDVKDSPTLPDVWEDLRSLLCESVLVSHTAFDRVAFQRAATRYGIRQLDVTWLDSARMVRRAWPESYGHRGYGLSNVADDLGISFEHHNALEDARAAAEIVLRVCESTEMDIEGWLSRVGEPIFQGPSGTAVVNREGNLAGELYGETVVFTGALSVSRRKVADKAAEAGCNVTNTVSKKCTMLVVGTQDMNKLNGYSKSSKHRKAEALIDEGAKIGILSESDFWELLGSDH